MTNKTAHRTLSQTLNELNTTLEELAEYHMLGWFPTDRHRIIYALAQDLGLTR